MAEFILDMIDQQSSPSIQVDNEYVGSLTTSSSVIQHGKEILS
jgi:hypothetical protein